MTGIPLAIGGKLAESALLGKARGIAAAIPRPVWYVLAGLAALFAGYLLHQHEAHKHDKALVASTIASRDAQWRARLATERSAAVKIRDAAEKLHAQINQMLKDRHDAQVRDNASTAAGLVRSGPGKAAAGRCGPVDHPGLPAAAGGVGRPAPGPGAAAGQVPPGDGPADVQQPSPGAVHDPELALVPWGWLVQIAQEHDDLLAYKAEDVAWHQEHAAAWARMRSARPSAR